MEKQIDKEIDLRQLFLVVKKRIWMIILCTMIFTTLGSLYASKPEIPIYYSDTRVYVQTNKESINDLMVVIREPVVMEEVISQLQLGRSAEALRDQIRVNAVENSMVLRLSVLDKDPNLAADIANAIVPAYKEVARGTVFYTNVMVLTEAKAKDNPVPINPRSYLAIYAGIVAGIAFGIVAVFIMDSLDETIKSEREIEQLLGIVVLGKVTRMKRRDIVKRTKKKRNLTLRGETVGT